MMKSLYTETLINIINNENTPLLSTSSVVFVPCSPSPLGVYRA